MDFRNSKQLSLYQKFTGPALRRALWLCSYNCAQPVHLTSVTRKFLLMLMISSSLFLSIKSAEALMDVADEKEALFLGEQAFDYGEFDNAIAYFEFAADEKPKDAKPRIALAQSYYWQGRYGEALKHFKEALSLKSDSLTKQYLTQAVKVLEENKALFSGLESANEEKVETLELRRQLIEALSEPPVYMMLLGPHLEVLEKAGLSDKNFLKQLADGYYEAGLLRKAVFYYERLIELGFGDGTLYERLADVQVARGWYEEAKLAYKKSLRLADGPSEKKRLKNLIMSLPADRYRIMDWIDEGEYNKAILATKEALAFNPGDVSAIAQAARIYEEKGDIKEAERLYKKALLSQPSWPTAHFLWGRFLYLKKQAYPEAIEEFRIYLAYLKETESRAENPKEKESRQKQWIQAVEMIAYIYHEFLNQPALAVKELETLIRQKEIKDPEIFYHLGAAYYKTKKRMSAFQAFKKVLAMNPDKDLKESAEKAIEALRFVPDYGQDDRSYEEEKWAREWNQGVSY